MKPLDLYPFLLNGLQRREAEIAKQKKEAQDKRRADDLYAIKRAGDNIIERFDHAMERLRIDMASDKKLSAEDRDREVVVIELYGKVLIKCYKLIVSYRPPLWVEHEIEVRRLTPALIRYYHWLSEIRNLSPKDLAIFQDIDDLLRLRLHSMTKGHLWPADKVEIEAIAEVLNIELKKTHIPGFVLNEPAVYMDGWHMIGGQNDSFG